MYQTYRKKVGRRVQHLVPVLYTDIHTDVNVTYGPRCTRRSQLCRQENITPPYQLKLSLAMRSQVEPVHTNLEMLDFRLCCLLADDTILSFINITRQTKVEPDTHYLRLNPAHAILGFMFIRPTNLELNSARTHIRFKGYSALLTHNIWYKNKTVWNVKIGGKGTPYSEKNNGVWHWHYLLVNSLKVIKLLECLHNKIVLSRYAFEFNINVTS